MPWELADDQLMEDLQQDTLVSSKGPVVNPRSPFHRDNENAKNDSLRFSFDDTNDNQEQGVQKKSPLYLKDPANIESVVKYDPQTSGYILMQKVGDRYYRRPYSMTMKEYQQYDFDQSLKNYWMERSRGEGANGGSSLVPDLKVGGHVLDKIFGSNTIRIKPQGSAELTFGINTTKVENPTLPENLRKTSSFDFDEKIQMNVTGTIGEKLKMDVNYNTEATFDFENQMRLEYTGDEDEIIKKVEAGNVSLPLSSTLITGGQNLFGVKTEMQFGKLSVTSVFSQQKGETTVVEMEKGAQKNEFEITADNYEANRHFFLSRYFKDQYDRALQNLPVINSGVNINKIEVWVTNKTSNFQEARNVVAFVDLGENSKNVPDNKYNAKAGVSPANEANDLYDKMTSSEYAGIRKISEVTNTLASAFTPGKDYEKVENARRLSDKEYILNPKLGFISLNQALNADEVLAVSYEYTIRGETFRVGEFTSDGVSAPQSLIMKLVKGTSLTPDFEPTWQLMMKNIYNIGAFQVNQEDFVLNILYQNDQAGSAVNYINEGDIKGETLLKVMNLDNLNSQLDPTPDGMFDFIQGITIYQNNGRIIFPVLEPFGSHLHGKINNDAVADKIAFKELYERTQSDAQQIAEKNKFLLKGSYKSSSSSEISLNALNVQPGSVKVTAGSRELIENFDYTVDYTLGRVKIINEALLGEPIKISSENNSLFNIQTKTLLGTHLDYRVNKDFNLGATVMHLSERPLTQKVNIGDEPISNTIWGLNGTYRTESQLLTTLLDKLPFLDTKEPSSIAIEGEFAQLLPGHNKGIGSSGTAYIDDFEGSETSIDMKNMNAWVLASTPQQQPDEFPEGNLNNDLAYGYNRAKLAWYIIDPLFLRNNSATPGHIKADKDQQSNHFVREIHETEIFPNKETPTGVPTNIAVLNLAYYPSEKGPYNYDVEGAPEISSGINPDGHLKDPESRWGGIMRKIETNDFEAANIEYIEFWMMDPFVEDPNHTGGELFFNLGNISEDVLKDSRKSFEHGLPISGDRTKVDSTIWGYVPQIQSSVNGFSNSNSSRKYQDVGMDGMSTEDEISFFEEDYLSKILNAPGLGANSEAYQMALSDPSGDDYHYFRGSDYDAQELSILDRYKKYNGPEGNSPTSENSPESYPTSATTMPDVEDINLDNTLSETEAYYQYRVKLNPLDMKVGQNFIVDKVTSNVKLVNGTEGSVDWYQFKIPVTDFDEAYGSISDFKSIRFMRMFMKGFDKEVVLRFARLDLVRDDWRRYQQSLVGEGENPDNDTRFDISAVNIEENASKEPVNYVLPPGIDRVVDPRNPQLRQLNEQAILLKVIDLEDGDARAAYKNLNMDVRQYKRLKLDVHAEEIEGYQLNDDDMSVFVRMGSDYKNNYYEYEIPLKLTAPGHYQNDNDDDRLAVWPDENRFDFALKIFQTIKQLRNDEMRRAGSDVDFLKVFERSIGELENNSTSLQAENMVRIVGNPNLGNVRTVMIGVRNRHKDSYSGMDSGEPKSVEVWFNEFRLTDFDEEGGWAANMRVTTKLADLGTVTWAGSTSTAGFGGIEQGVNERSKEDVFQYDFSTSLELGKFFPENSGVSIPLYYAQSEQTINPEYNPLDPDIPLDVALDNAANKHERDSIKKIAQDYTKRKSFNLTNVRIEKQKGKSKLLDVSNLSLTYSYNETYSRNVNTVRDLERNYRGVLSYNYNARPKNVQPLKKVKLFRSPTFRLLRDFNFYYLPTRLSFRSDISRHYNEILNRNIDNPGLLIEPTFNKDFIWNRYYDLKYNLTKNLKFDFSATNTSRIDEPEGIVDKKRDGDAYEIWKDSVWNNILDGGRNVQYHHNFNVTYTLPINKIPLLNWTSVTTRYTGTYDWDAGAITADTIQLGNVVRNSNNIQVNGQLNLVNLYNKVGILKKINRKYGQQRKYKGNNKKFKKVNYDETVPELRANVPKTIYHKLKTENITVKVYDMQGREVKARTKVTSQNRVKVTVGAHVKNARVRIAGKIEQKDNIFVAAGETLLRTLMSVRNISMNYSQVNSTTLPGYLPATNYFGGETFNGTSAPGFGFLVGNQNVNFARDAAEKGWLTVDPTLNSPYLMTHTENFTFRSTIEPVRGFKIDVTANRNYSKNRSEYYIYNEDEGQFTAENKLQSGNFSMSFLSLKSAFFTMGDANNYSSKYFQEFLDRRQAESLRLAKKRWGDQYIDHEMEEAPGYYEGYGPTSQDVLVPAFLQAYGGADHSDKLFPTLLKLKPNWRVTFDGLSKVDWVKRYFKSINLSHAYSSTYDVGSYQTNLGFFLDDFGFSADKNMMGNYLSRYEANTVSINERFNPLINVDMIWANNFTSRFEIKRTRQLILSLANTQLTETASNEMIFGLGYRFDNFGMIIGSGSRQKKFKSDLNLRGDLSIRKNSTIIRKIVDEVDQLTSGQKVVTLKFSADYVLSNRFNLRLFYDRIVNEPFVSLAYPTTNTNFGASVRFTLTQ